MRKHFTAALLGLGLLAILNSCSKEEQAVVKPVTTSDNPLDPGNNGFYTIAPGELYYYEDSITTYDRATEHYLQLKPLSLEKYKNGALLDSVCNKDLALYFDSKALKTQDKSARWGLLPRVVDEHAPIVTVHGADNLFTIKMSKMVKAFGLEINSPFKGSKYGVTVRFWNSKLNKGTEDGGGTRYLNGDSGDAIRFGNPGGAFIWGVEGTKGFDEVRISFEGPQGQPAPGSFDISFSGFRYKLAK
jgi:hypothetical protein